MHTMYGEVPAKKQPSAEALRTELKSIAERSDQIVFILRHLRDDDAQGQELRSELSYYQNRTVEINRILSPPKADVEIQKQQAESLRQQAAEAAKLHAALTPLNSPKRYTALAPSAPGCARGSSADATPAGQPRSSSHSNQFEFVTTGYIALEP